jgi:hypothetical protein
MLAQQIEDYRPIIEQILIRHPDLLKLTDEQKVKYFFKQHTKTKRQLKELT